MYRALETLSQAALLFAAIFVMTAIGIAVARRYRDREADDMSESSDMMSKFRELHCRGWAERRRIPNNKNEASKRTENRVKQ